MRVRLDSPKHYFCNETDKLWTLMAIKVPFCLTSLGHTNSHSFLGGWVTAEIRPATAHKKDDCTSSMPYYRYVKVTIIRTAAL